MEIIQLEFQMYFRILSREIKISRDRYNKYYYFKIEISTNDSKFSRKYVIGK